MTVTVIAPPAVTVFEVYRPLPGTLRHPVRMAQLTADTAALIAAEPGVWLRARGGRWELFSRGAWVAVGAGDYIARFGHDPASTGVLAAAYVHEHYSREPM